MLSKFVTRFCSEVMGIPLFSACYPVSLRSSCIFFLCLAVHDPRICTRFGLRLRRRKTICT